MKVSEMKKVIRSRASKIVRNYNKIKNVSWTKTQGVGEYASNMYDDIIRFQYEGNEYILESKYTGSHSAVQEHTVNFFNQEVQ